MKPWVRENAALVLVLASAAFLADLPRDAQTLGWAVGAFALHTARSHAGRMREDAGHPLDWTSTVAAWLGGAAALLAASAPQRVLLGVPLAASVAHTLYRVAYRRARPVRPTSWSREDD